MTISIHYLYIDSNVKYKQKKKTHLKTDKKCVICVFFVYF